MNVRFVAEFKSIDRISPLVFELEHIVGKDRACKIILRLYDLSGKIKY